MQTKYPIYLAGEFRETSDSFEVMNPYDHSKVAVTFRAGNAEFEEAVIKAGSVKEKLVDWPSSSRYAVLMQIAELMRADRKQMAEDRKQRTDRLINMPFDPSDFCHLTSVI